MSNWSRNESTHYWKMAVKDGKMVSNVRAVTWNIPALFDWNENNVPFHLFKCTSVALVGFLYLYVWVSEKLYEQTAYFSEINTIVGSIVSVGAHMLTTYNISDKTNKK